MTSMLLSLCLGSCGFRVGFTLVQTVCQTGYEETQLVKFVVTSHSVIKPFPDHILTDISLLILIILYIYTYLLTYLFYIIYFFRFFSDFH